MSKWKPGLVPGRPVAAGGEPQTADPADARRAPPAQTPQPPQDSGWVVAKVPKGPHTPSTTPSGSYVALPPVTRHTSQSSNVSDAAPPIDDDLNDLCLDDDLQPTALTTTPQAVKRSIWTPYDLVRYSGRRDDAACQSCFQEVLGTYLGAGARCLEVGSGNGDLVRLLGNTHAIQQSDGSAEVVQDHHQKHSDSTMVLAHIGQLSEDLATAKVDTQYDAVIGVLTLDTLEAAEHPAALADIGGVLRPGGYLIHFIDVNPSANIAMNEILDSGHKPWPLQTDIAGGEVMGFLSLTQEQANAFPYWIDAQNMLGSFAGTWCKRIYQFLKDENVADWFHRGGDMDTLPEMDYAGKLYALHLAERLPEYWKFQPPSSEEVDNAFREVMAERRSGNLGELQVVDLIEHFEGHLRHAAEAAGFDILECGNRTYDGRDIHVFVAQKRAKAETPTEH